MTTDMERELRELFRDKAGEAPVATFGSPATAPQDVLRRGRRRQVGTVLGSAAIVLVLIVGSVAGLNAMLRGKEDPYTTGRYEVFQRTATIEAFTVTSPSDWYFVNEWPLSMQMAVGSGSASGECTAAAPGASPVCTGTTQSPQVEALPYGLPMFQLSNVDMGLNTVPCGQSMARDAAVLYVGLDFGQALFGANDTTIPEFPPGIGLPPEGDGPCGRGRYAHFTVNGEPFFAWIGTGPDVSDQDRETIETSYEMMSAIPDWEPVPPTETTPAYVVAGGVNEAGDEWRLEVRPSQDDIKLSLIGGNSLVAALSDFVVPRSVIEWAATDPIFGAVTKQAAAVEFRSKIDPPVATKGTILPLPPSLPFDFDLFFIEGTAGLDGDAVALGPDGAVIEGGSSVGRVRQAEVELSGSLLGHDWSARFSGAFTDRDACIDVRVDGKQDPTGPNCRRNVGTSWAGASPSLDGWVLPDMYIGAGSVPSNVIGMRFRSDGTSRPEVTGICRIGPTGWTDHNVCAIALPPEDSGTFEYLDANDGVVSGESASWGPADPPGTPLQPVEPVHGGSFWAVYPWTGAAGAPEANDVVGQIFDDFGIQAWQGDIACDQGAADAVGTSVDWRVAVYFANGQDADAFADAYRTRHPGSDPVTAHVTTYCLD